MKSPLIDHNRQLYLSESGIWTNDDSASFDYSDGAASELFLMRVLKNSTDIGSASRELEICYAPWDWPSEYHFTPKRANILRALDFGYAKSALELGSGCGAITRYLGEIGLEVDAVEGARPRAQITRLRCRDLENVTVINANFNELTFPEKAYDLIFFVGVLEYAAKFLPDASTEEAAVLEIVAMAKRALKEDGVLIIAIENRFGLKYWLGATEDHHGEPYAGLYGYKGKRGVKTFTYDEWREILNTAEIDCRFLYPFPDYKLSDVILSEEFLNTDPFAHSLLYRVKSRDYLKNWSHPANEFLIWKALHQKNDLHRFSNSFLIVASRDIERINETIKADFVCFPGVSRKPQYRSMTIKPKGRSVVYKKNLNAASKLEMPGDIQKADLEEPYVSGPLLSTFWLTALSTPSDWDGFGELLIRYHEFIMDQFGKAEIKNFDMLPTNIIVGANRAYHLIDNEWSGDFDLCAEFFMFRALLWFSCENCDSLRSAFQARKIRCPKDFILVGAALVGIELSEETLGRFIEQEEQIQQVITLKGEPRPVRKIVEEVFPSYLDGPGPDRRTARLYWSEGTGNFTEEKSIFADGSAERNLQRLVFRFFSPEPIVRFRFNPSLTGGYFQISRITLFQKPSDENGDREIGELCGAERIADSCILSDIYYTPTAIGGIFFAPSGDGHFTFDFSTLGGSNAAWGFFELAIEMTWPRSIEFLEAQKAYQSALARKEIRIDPPETRFLAAEVFGSQRQRPSRVDPEQGREIGKQHPGPPIIGEKNGCRYSAFDIFSLKIRLLQRDIQIRRLTDRIHSLTRSKIGKVFGLRGPAGNEAVNEGSSLAQRHELRQAYDLIKTSGLFDEAYYRGQAGDLSGFQGDAILHYLTEGVLLGFDPHPLFKSAYYIERYPDRVHEIENPLAHYVQTGARDGLDPSPYFVSRYYLERYPDVERSGVNPLYHFMTTGYKEKRWPHPLFDSSYYCQAHPEILSAGLNPWLDFLFSFRQGEGKNPNPFFDTAYYLNRYPDIASAGINPLIHYYQYGAKENRNPCLLFRTDYYRGNHPEVDASGVDPLSHYLSTGLDSGLNPHPLFDGAYYRDTYPDVQGAGMPVLSHYMKVGIAEKRNPHPLLDVSFLLNQASDPVCAASNPPDYYLETEDGKTCHPHPLFNTDYYLSIYPEVAAYNIQPLLHYLLWGEKERRKPHPLFDVEHYISGNPKAAESGMNALAHYIRFGEKEGGNPHPLFDCTYYRKRYPDVAASGANALSHYVLKGAQQGRSVMKEIEILGYKPKISIVLLWRENKNRQLLANLYALTCQIYPILEVLHFVNPGQRERLEKKLAWMAGADRRISLTFLNDYNNLPAVMNGALEKASGEFVLFLDADVFLHCDALYAFVELLNRHPGIDIVSSIAQDLDLGRKRVPQSYDAKEKTTYSCYVGQLALYRKSLLETSGGFKTWHTGVKDPDFLANIVGRTHIGRIAHLPKKLHYRVD